MSDDYETSDVPGVGEIRARKGTATQELAGAAAFWSKKYKSAKRDGFLAAVFAIAFLEIVSGIAYHYIRSH